MFFVRSEPTWQEIRIWIEPWDDLQSHFGNLEKRKTSHWMDSLDVQMASMSEWLWCLNGHELSMAWRSGGLDVLDIWMALMSGWPWCLDGLDVWMAWRLCILDVWVDLMSECFWLCDFDVWIAQTSGWPWGLYGQEALISGWPLYLDGHDVWMAFISRWPWYLDGLYI